MLLKNVLRFKLLPFVGKRNVSKFARKNFTLLQEDHVQFFESLLGTSGTLSLSKNDDLNAYNSDWLNQYKGKNKTKKPLPTEYCL